MPSERDRAPVTLRAAERAVAARLRAAGIDTPDLDARLLVEAASGTNRLTWIREPDAGMLPATTLRLEEFVRQRLARVPVSRILGEREFYGRAFEITPATLDPRPDSETLIETALAIFDAEGWRDQDKRILDIGTGSGCLLVTLLAELPRASGLGTDVDPGALAVAARNGVRHGVSGRAAWRIARSLQNVAGRFQLIVSNPPYVRSADIAGLAPEVRQYDPHTALDGGPDGLAIVREIVAGLDGSGLAGWCLFEAGFDQAAEIVALLHGCARIDPTSVRVARDLAGQGRCVAAKSHF